MKDNNINLAILKNDPDGKGYELYRNILIKVVVGYVLDKGYTVQIFTNEKNEEDGIIFLENIIISVRWTFWSCNIKQLEYYLKVFLGQKITHVAELDYQMLQRLGELYPCQYKTLPDIYFMDIAYLSLVDIYDEFLQGIDVFKNEYINNWKERIIRVLHWIDTLNIDLSMQPIECQKLYEAAVRSINEQPEAPYYLVLIGSFWLKLTKKYYIKILGVYLTSSSFLKCVYVDILNLEVTSYFFFEEFQTEDFHLTFPQVFSCFSLEHWHPVRDFYLINTDLPLKIKKVYISKLWVKHYDLFKDCTSFFQKFPNVKDLQCTENAMLNFLDSLIDKNELNLFLSIFLDWLRPLKKSYKEKNHD